MRFVVFSVRMKANWPSTFIAPTAHAMNILLKVHVKDSDSSIYQVANVDVMSNYLIIMKRRISATKLVRDLQTNIESNELECFHFMLQERLDLVPWVTYFRLAKVAKASNK